jgi:lysozyme
MNALSPRGLALIQEFEGCRLTAYRDQRGVLSIGTGHTGADVTEGLVWSQAQADAALRNDTSFAAAAINRYVDVALNQNEFDALCSLAFNIGVGAFRSSTLLRMLNMGDHPGAAMQFAVWDRVNGEQNAGLARRRSAEQVLFLAPC